MASRKDYNALAEVLNELQHYGQPGSRHIIAAKMAKVFAADNERFDGQRFYEACDIDIDFAVQEANALDTIIRKNASDWTRWQSHTEADAANA